MWTFRRSETNRTKVQPMKKITLLLTIISLSIHAFSQGIEFEHGDLKSVMAKARATGKMIFVDVYTIWCGPCKRMAQTTFQQPAVGNYFNSQFINYKIDAERGEGVEFAKKYSVKFFPTYLFIDSDGKLYGKAIGYRNDTSFLEVSQAFVNDFRDPNNLANMQAAYSKKMNDTAFLSLFIEKLVANEQPATTAIEQYLSIQTGIAESSPQMMQFLTRYWKQLPLGGKADQLLKTHLNQYRAAANTQQLKLLIEGGWIRLNRTFEYAKEQKDEALMKLYEAAWLNASENQGYKSREGLWLEFYAQTGNWNAYRKHADHWLDSLIRKYDDLPVPGVPVIYEGMRKRNYFFPGGDGISNERKALAYMVNEHARIYYAQFGKEPEVLQKTRRWTERAMAINDNHYKIQSTYANFLYLCGDKTKAIRWKQHALGLLSPTSGYRAPVEANLLHIQQGEALETEN